MSAGRYEIFDDGPCIRIVSPDSTISTIVGRPVGYHIDDAVIGAIRQQARDLDQLRADLAAAVAERDRMARRIKDLDAECSVIAKDCTYAEQQNDTLRARLAAIDGAPTVAMLCPLTESAFNESTLMTAYQKAKMPHVELIARPAKD